MDDCNETEYTQRLLARIAERNKAHNRTGDPPSALTTTAATNNSKHPLTESTTSNLLTSDTSTARSSPRKSTPQSPSARSSSRSRITASGSASPARNKSTNHSTTTKATTPSKQTTTISRRIGGGTAATTSSRSENAENCDVAVEINITAGQHVNVQVEFEEHDVDADGNILRTGPTHSVQHSTQMCQSPAQKRNAAAAALGQAESGSSAASSTATAAIRDTSRHRLQRLGALYSDTENLSSPIHRNEARFHADERQPPADAEQQQEQQQRRRPMAARSNKLAALADSIKTWQDESSGPNAAAAQVQLPVAAKRDSPVKQQQQPKPPQPSARTPPAKSCVRPTATQRLAAGGGQLAKGGAESAERSPAKQLKWDKSVLDSLEAQGFARRESNQSRMVYDYGKQEHVAEDEPEAAGAEEPKAVESPEPVKVATHKYVASEPSKPSSQGALKKTVAPQTGDSAAPKSLASVVAKGLVSGRAALFETGRGDRAPAPKGGNKDPAEMSLKDRLALFEKNKGTALVPKAAFGMSASQKQISGPEAVGAAAVATFSGAGGGRGAVAKTPQAPAALDGQTGKIDAYNKAVLAESNAAGNGIRSTVAALMNKGATISESEIAADVRKQRDREMNMLLNRHQRDPACERETPVQASQLPTETRASAPAAAAAGRSLTTAQPPPPPPPPPPAHKRKSDGAEAVAAFAASRQRERDDAHSPLKEEAKRPKKLSTNTASNRLYPVLSDIESTTATESDADESTAALGQSEFGDEEVEYVNVGTYGRRELCNEYATEEEEDDDDGDEDDANIHDMSLGREIMNAVQRNEQQRQRRPSLGGRQYAAVADCSTVASSEMSSQAGDDMDDYLDEALEYADDDDDAGDANRAADDDDDDAHLTPARKGTISSNSFQFARSPAKPPRLHEVPTPGSEQHQQHEHKSLAAAASGSATTAAADYRNPIKSELRVDPSTDNNIVTLTHTVSFYRRQQATGSVSNTPVRKVTYADRRIVEETEDEEPTASASSSADPQAAAATELARQQAADKVRRLLDEIRKQEHIIAQTSQALNLCAATVEFSGSTESVEGERHLLVANHRRQAALNEVQRLRFERCVREAGAPADQGRLSVGEITVPLKPEYRDKLISEAICGHQLVCLLKYNEHVVATKTVPTLPGLLAVKFPDVLHLDCVYSDFAITLEIYGMLAQRENVPHELKYHINRKTPKGGASGKKGGHSSRLVMPVVQSPGGPGAVRTPALTHYGMVIFSQREIRRTNWTMHQVSPISPLAGAVQMKVNMEIKMHIEMRGFLTMFEDVSGFGAWHRRWCRLHDTQLSFWKYPDDERTKQPIGTIDLRQCWTQQVQAVARDVCARQHTMELEIRRQSEEGDRDSLVLQRKAAGYTVLRHLLSADTKEERVEWSAYFNKALILVRSWGMGSASGTFK